MMNQLKRFFKEEEGQGMTEYGLVLGVIAVGAIAILSIFGNELVAKIKGVTENIFPGSTAGVE